MREILVWAWLGVFAISACLTGRCLNRGRYIEALLPFTLGVLAALAILVTQAFIPI